MVSQKILKVGGAAFLAVSLVGCSLGPVHLTHREGHMPKFHMDSGLDACKLGAKIQNQSIKATCTWELDI